MAGRAKSLLAEIYQAAVRAAQPSVLLQRQIKISAHALTAENERGHYRFPLTGKVYLVGVGKGADTSAPFWTELLGDKLAHGIFLVRDRLCRERLERISILVGGHPLPDRRGLTGTGRILEMLRGARPEDCVIFCLMGGASSLMVRPAAGLTLADKSAVTDALLKSGMTIAEINCVRKHLSGVKAGGLLRAAYPASVVTLAISDVIGDDPAVIGSAPSTHDPTTFKDAWHILQRYHLLGKIPTKVKSYLLRGARGEFPETLKAGSALSARSPFLLLANNKDALSAAKSKAQALGFAVTVLATDLSGDSRGQAKKIGSQLKSFSSGKTNRRRPHCVLVGGETTVQVRGKGLGGRNQEFALASATELRGCPGIYLLSAGSDGSDGSTDAAGAFADGDTFRRARSLGLDPYQALRDNDSYPLFNRLGDLFRPGPTGTNVLDFIIALKY